MAYITDKEEWRNFVTERQEWNKLNSKHLVINTDIILNHQEPGQYIWELLQNAEDAQATFVKIDLSSKSMFFQHNGNIKFSLEDAKSISRTGYSNKERKDRIGQFGLGFKSVFRYTNKVQIISEDFNFEIYDKTNLRNLELSEIKVLDTPFTTGFHILFNRDEINQEKALNESLEVLREWNENTILFLKNIQKIEVISTNLNITINKKISSENTVEISAKKNGQVDSSYWLQVLKNRTVKVFDGNDEFRFEKNGYLGFAIKIETVDGFLRALPQNSANVFTYFPLKYQKSNLKFHIHAPFAINQSRNEFMKSAMSETVNEGLVSGIANLLTETTSDLFSKNVINLDFLEVLPLLEDDIPPLFHAFLTILRSGLSKQAILDVGDRQKYLPSQVIRSNIEIYNVFGDRSGVEILVDTQNFIKSHNRDEPSKAIVMMKNSKIHRVNSFLSQIGVADISKEKISNFLIELDQLFKKNNSEGEFGIPRKFLDWISRKEIIKLRDLYFLISDLRIPSTIFHHIPLIRVNVEEPNVKFLATKQVFLPAENTKFDEDVIYWRLFETTESEKTKLFTTFEEMEIEKKDRWVLLKKYYGKGSIGRIEGHDTKEENSRIDFLLPLYVEDPDRFISYVKESIQFIGTDINGEAYWVSPDKLFMVTTETRIDWDKIRIADSKKDIKELWNGYTKSKDFIAMIKDLGVHDNIFLHGSGPSRTVSYLEGILLSKDLNVITELWLLLSQIQTSGDFEIYVARSKLATELARNLIATEWIPTREGAFVAPFKANKENLHPNLKLNDAPFLNIIKFGGQSDLDEQDLENKRMKARELGFESLEHAQLMIKLGKQYGFEALQKLLKESHLVEKENLSNPERLLEELIRSENVNPAIMKEVERVIGRPNYSQNQIERRMHLRRIYGIDGKIACQLCQIQTMPFKYVQPDENGTFWDYFETINFFSNAKKESKLNAIALCPVCSSKLKGFRNQISELNQTNLFNEMTRLKNLVKDDNLVDPRNLFIELTVLGEKEKLFFSRRHVLDLYSCMVANI